ncbi:hypothetical protein [Aurantimonas sp. Leaf443]|uniref:hypothetical protein n=1 Tax=Aurantimonas sp. Leaf443 TaxID=1736378 RepID=UPI0012E367AD|nr:hypothetical protein [Aurantimonas sp. Leaf443]
MSVFIAKNPCPSFVAAKTSRPHEWFTGVVITEDVTVFHAVIGGGQAGASRLR